MGTHARPRRRVRSAALGTLAVGATLTGVGLTAAALDSSGAGLADGTLSTEPVNFAASGLGAPVPVAGVSSLGGSPAGKSAAVTTSGSGGGANGDAVLGAPFGGYSGYSGYAGYVTSGKAAGSKTAGSTAAGSKAAGSETVVQAASAATSGVARVKQIEPTVTAPRHNLAPAPASAGSTGSGGDISRADVASTDGVAPMTSPASGATGASSGAGRGGSTDTTTGVQIPSLDARLPISTALPLPSLPSVPTISSLPTTVNQAKSTLAALLDKIAGMI